jgi:hypothetical protein
MDWRVFAATTALLLEGPHDLGLVEPSDTHNLPEPTIAQYAVIRRHLKSVATAAGVPLINVERALYRLTKKVEINPDRRWSTYRHDLLAAADAWDVSEASNEEDAYGEGVQEDSTD